MFDANSPYDTSEVLWDESCLTSPGSGPWTFTIQREYGLWCAQFSQCNVPDLIRSFHRRCGEATFLEIPLEHIPGFPPPPSQWVENTRGITGGVELLSAPEEALAKSGGRVGFIQIDELHATTYATHLTDLYAVWCAWLEQRYPAQDMEIDPHRDDWAKQASLLWPHPPGQWSQLLPVGRGTITAFDIIDLGWNAEGKIFSRRRTRILKTSDKSWRTGWMW